MKIRSLKVSNLFSFGDTEVVFDDSNNQFLVLGQNVDDPGLSSNGSGKSSLLESVCWILYKSTSRDVYKNEVRRRAGNVLTKSSYGKLVLGSDGGDELIIERSIGERNFLRLGVNGKDRTMKNETITQGVLEDFIGVDFRSFVSLNYFSKEEANVLCSGSNAERMKFLENLLGLSIFEKCFEVVKGDVRKFDNEESLNQDRVETIEREIMLLNDVPSELKEHKTEFNELQERLKNLEKRYSELSKVREHATEREYLEGMKIDLSNLRDEVKSGEKDRKNFESIVSSLSKNKLSLGNIKQLNSSLDKANREIDRKNSEVTSLSVMVKQRKDVILKLEKSIKRKGGKCPLCLTLLSGTTLSHIKSEMIKCKDEILDLTKKKDVLSKSIIKDKSERQRLEEDVGMFGDVETKLALAKKDLESCVSTLKGLEKKYKEKNVVFTEKSKKIPKTAKKFDQEKYDRVRSSLENARDSISEKKSRILYLEDKLSDLKKFKRELKFLESRSLKISKNKNMLSFWEEGFGKYGIPKKIVNGFLPIFEERVNRILADLEFNISISLDTKIKKQSGKDSYSSGFGIEVVDLRDFTVRKFNTFSEGERKRIVIAMMVSLREIFSNKEAGLDFLMFDEVLDSLDDIGRERFVRILEKIEGQKFIISHNEEMENLFPSKIVVCKRNGVSHVEAGL